MLIISIILWVKDKMYWRNKSVGYGMLQKEQWGEAEQEFKFNRVISHFGQSGLPIKIPYAFKISFRPGDEYMI